MQFYRDNNNSCIIKPIKTGLVKGVVEEGIVFTSQIEVTEHNIKRVSPVPVYLQKLINKKGDIRVTVVGDKIFAAFIDSQGDSEAKVDWRKSSHILPYRKLELPNDISQKCLLLLNRLNLKFGAIDFILDEFDNYIFLEINPNGQWAWIEVVAMLQRDGNIVTIVTPLANGEAIKPFIYANVAPGATVITDGFGAYKGLDAHYTHEIVMHSENEYVREGNIHTNTLEGFWSQLKRGIIGIYHNVSPKHLHRYCHEFGYKYNTRKATDVARFEDAFGKVNNIRLTYAKLIS